jgi:hypothetical protein
MKGYNRKGISYKKGESGEEGERVGEREGA